MLDKNLMKRAQKILGLLFGVTISVVSNAVPAPDVGKNQPVRPYDGFWLTEGYGQFIEIRGDVLTSREITAVSCLEPFVSNRDPHHLGNAVRYVNANINQDLGAENAFVISSADNPTSAWMHVEGTISKIGLRKINQKPEICNIKTPNTSISNYNIFWHTWAENYPFFALHNYDWDAVDLKFRLKVKARTSDKQLFQIFKAMIEPLRDAHTGVGTNKTKSLSFEGFRQDGSKLSDADIKRSRQIIDTKYVQGGMALYCNGKIHFGMLPDNIGYIRIDNFYDYDEKPEMAVQTAALEAALDEIFNQKKSLNGLIIDVRRNNGGSDEFGINIARRLTQRSYLAYKKVSRNNPTDYNGLTAPQPVMVDPSSRSGFFGDVIILTSAYSISAAETFAQALMAREPHVKLIGDATQGVFSDVLLRQLPNGFHFELPNEIYLTGDGKSFDFSGIPVDIRTAIFSENDLRTGTDSALDAAITSLAEARH
jgi:C-terminal processing protease CtpA/Prc